MTSVFGKFLTSLLNYVNNILENVHCRSATNMRWIEEKMKLLGCDKNPNYKLAFYLDSR